MQLSITQLKDVIVGTELFLINPFGNGVQSNVGIETFTVHKVESDMFNGRIQFLSRDIDYEDDHYFSDMTRKCKYVYTNLKEAESKLKDVRNGLHSLEVSDWHLECELFDL